VLSIGEEERMRGSSWIGYRDDLALGVRGRPGPQRPPGKPTTDCRDDTTDLVLGVRGRPGPQRPPGKPGTDCRGDAGEPGPGVRWRPGEQPRPPYKPVTNCRAYLDVLPFGE
jgi:hypothetical protein